MRPRTRLFRLILYVVVIGCITAKFRNAFLDLYYAQRTTPGVNKVTSDRLGYTQIKSIPVNYVPIETKGTAGRREPEKRIVFIGDVHGMYQELMELLETISYNDRTDHLVFAGDLVTKGPGSLQVLEFARTYGASCVRGNQDDRVLLHYHQLHSSPIVTPSTPSMEYRRKYTPLNHKLRSEKVIAAAMTEDQAAWLDNCPQILTATSVRGLGNVAIVHAGLVHGIELEQQDPSAVMNMRSIDMRFKVPSHRPDAGKHWADLWNAQEKQSKDPLTVIYGHYAAAGLDLRTFTKGLDSSCAHGGHLSALVVSSKGEKTPKLISVECKRAGGTPAATAV